MKSTVIKIKLKEDFMKKDYFEKPKRNISKTAKIMEVLSDGNWWSAGEISRLPHIDSIQGSVSTVLLQKYKKNINLERDDSGHPVLYRFNTLVEKHSVKNLTPTNTTVDVVIEVIKELHIKNKEILKIAAKLITLVIESKD
jgi:hypothetical protein